MNEDDITKEEIEEALALLHGESSVTIEPARKKVVRHKGRMVEVEEAAYVKFSTNFKKELADLGEYALKVFLYIGLSIGFESGSSHPGIRKIAEDTKMNKDTVAKAVEELEEKGFLEVCRREGASNVYTPIRYISIGKTVPPDRTVGDGLSEDETKLSDENAKLSDARRVNLHNQINKNNNKTQLSAEDYRQANQKVDAILAMSKKGIGMWKGRDLFNDNVLVYADWYFNKTGQIPSKRTEKSWIKAFSEWLDDGLSVDDLEQARVARLKWKEFIADPNELTKDASAIKAQKNVAPKDDTPRTTGTGFYA